MSLFLQTIPTELIDMILNPFCKHLVQLNCRHCSSPRCTCHEDTAQDFIDEALPCISALASLSRTCKQLRQVTNWRLYYCPVTRGPRDSWYLTRTILVRPDLAQLVKFLVIEGFRFNLVSLETWPRHDNEKIPSEIIQYYMEAASNHEPNHRYPDGAKLAAFKRGRGVPIDLITSLCPNLEHLEFQGNSIFLNPRIMFWSRRRSTNTLKNIIIRCGEEWTYYRDADLELLLRWAPNLQGIFLSCFHNGVMGRTYTNRDSSTLQLNFVKILKITESKLLEEDISRLLSLCPNLEEFAYQLDLEEFSNLRDLTLDPMHAVRVVHNHLHVNRGKLKRFVVDLSETIDLLQQFLFTANHEGLHSNLWNLDRIPPSDYYNFLDEDSDELPKATEMLAKLGVEFVCELGE